MKRVAAAGNTSARAEILATGRRRPLAFVREFLKSPKELGTCFTSSPALSRAMVRDMGLEHARCVVELGPGTGPLTEQILNRIPRDCAFFAIERNAALVAALRARWPLLRVHNADAADIADVCRLEGVKPGVVDAIVCSLPFLLFPAPVQATILHEAASVLRPGGRFSTVTYRPEALMGSVKRFRALMEREFSRVRLARVVLGNFPPAFVYRCTK